MSSLGNKDIMSKNLKRFMNQKGVNRKELSQAIGIPYSTLSEWVSGNAYPRIDNIEKMANFFGVEKADLVEEPSWRLERNFVGDLFPIPRAKKVPMLGSVACGIPIYMEEEHGEYFPVSPDLQVDFCLRAQGDSMNGATIKDGDIVFIQSTPKVENGQIAAVAINDEATLKYFYQYGDTVVLRPANSNYKELIYRGKELDNLRILGRAVVLQSRL